MMKDERGHCRSPQSYFLCTILPPSGPVCLSEARCWKYSRNTWYDAALLDDFCSRINTKYWNVLWFKSGAELYQYKCRPGFHRGPVPWVNGCESCCMAGWSVFISLFIDSLAFLWVFEINNSQQKSDRGMKISTFPAVKPFIKLTRGRIGAEEERRGKWRLEREQRAGGKQVHSEGEGGREGGKVTLGTEAKWRKLSLFGRRRRRVVWRIAGQTGGGAGCHSKKEGQRYKERQVWHWSINREGGEKHFPLDWGVGLEFRAA